MLTNDSREGAAHGASLLREDLFELTDGRSLAYAEWGEPAGVPVILLHGTPGTHHACPDNDLADETTVRLGVRLVTISRPGYSRSTPQPGRTLLGWVDDVAQLADALALDRFALIGVSGGGPYAMACAFRLPERVGVLSLVSTGGPLDEVPGDRDVLAPDTRAIVDLVRTDPERALKRLIKESSWLTENPEAVLDPSGWPESDRWIVEDPTARELMLEEMREAGRLGPLGHVWDVMGFHREWGFSPRQIRVPTQIWHGESDGILSPRHFVYLAMAIPEARATLWPGQGHTAIFRGPYWGQVLEGAIGALNG